MAIPALKPTAAEFLRVADDPLGGTGGVSPNDASYTDDNVPYPSPPDMTDHDAKALSLPLEVSPQTR